jgi:hypothetical protein
MLHRMAMTEQDIRTFQGALKALARAVKPRKPYVRDGE